MGLEYALQNMGGNKVEDLLFVKSCGEVWNVPEPVVTVNHKDNFYYNLSLVSPDENISKELKTVKFSNWHTGCVGMVAQQFFLRTIYVMHLSPKELEARKRALIGEYVCPPLAG